jgi:hypothetical protein
MKQSQRSSSGRRPRRRTSRPRVIRIVLRPGQRLVTDTVIVTARKRGGGGRGVTTSVSCACTKSDPDTPDCKPTTTTSPDGHTTYTKCSMSGGCKECKQTTTTTSIGLTMA